MPHFILDCSNDVFERHSQNTVMDAVFDTAQRSGLFAVEDIKVRVRTFEEYRTGTGRKPFVHVFAYIMEGRSTQQKAALSRDMVQTLLDLFPDIDIVSLNVMDFEKATYNNRRSLEAS